jgi:hypothetical protein
MRWQMISTARSSLELALAQLLAALLEFGRPLVHEAL